MINWASAYSGLARAGYTDQQIATMAGVDRTVINKIRHNRYPHDHAPRYENGVAVLAALTEAVRLGYLETCPVHEVASGRTDA